MKRGEIQSYADGYGLCLRDCDADSFFTSVQWFPTLYSARIRRETIRLQEEEIKEINALELDNGNHEDLSEKTDEIHKKYEHLITWAEPVAWKNDPA